MRLFSGLRLKLLLLAGVPLVSLIAVGTLAYLKSAEVGEWVHVIGDRNVPQLVTSYEIEGSLLSTLRSTNGVFMNWENPEQREKFEKGAHQNIAELQRQFEVLAKIEKSPQVQELFDKASSAAKSFAKHQEELLAKMEHSTFTPQEKVNLMEDYSTGAAAKAKEELILHTENLVGKLKSLIAERTKHSVAASDETKSGIIIGLAVALTLSLVLLVIFFRAIFSGMKQIQEALVEASTQVKMASEHLSAASQQLSQSASESASSLEESVASMHELSSMVQLNAANSKQASELSQKSRSEADRGGEEMGELAQKMAQIQQSSSKMEEIIGVIDDIAFQTNLLALNAAVEAARAGDQGKGFAVVAEAVRALAQKSAASAKEISDLIKESSAQVDIGVQTTDRSQKAFHNVVESIRKISEISNEIANASQEQASGITQATAGMNQLDQGVQSNAATAEEIAASSEELTAQVQSLQGTIEQLNHIIDGGFGSGSGNIVPFPSESRKQKAA